MAHNLTIYDGVARFADNERSGPAWHKLCQQILDNQNASEAWERIGKGITYHKLPLGVKGNSGYCAFPNYFGLCSIVEGHHDGGETVNGHTLYSLGTVQSGYVPLFAPETVQVIDKTTGGMAVDTLGLLGKSGHTLFCSLALPHFDVAGDEIASYLNIGAPMNGVEAVWARTGAVRMVCANTMAMAMAEHTDHAFASRHYANIAQRLEEWLRVILLQQGQVLETIKEACTVLALASCSPTTLKNGVLSTVYPYPDRPEDAKLVEPWEKVCLKLADRRTTVSRLFDGSPTSTVATKGTLWGAYQAVVEYEDYYRPRATAMSKVFGAGKERKEAAFAACMSLV